MTGDNSVKREVEQILKEKARIDLLVNAAMGSAAPLKILSMEQNQLGCAT
ncbi:MAG TPA: hypothetical protein VGJ42_01470 [Nitrososphaera sp.]